LTKKVIQFPVWREAGGSYLDWLCAD